MRVYIAGPMRGIKYYNFEAFDDAAEWLDSQGHEVINPADMDREDGFYPTELPDDHDWSKFPDCQFTQEEAIERDLDAIMQCDAIYMLKGWERSKGATAEKALAEWLGLEVLYQDEPATKTIEDGDTITNEHGGKQSFILARFDAIPPVVLRLLAQCLGFGANKYGMNNWQSIPLDDNLSHAMNHINEWRMGDRSEPHLVNAMARLTFSLWHAVQQEEQPDRYIHPEMAAPRV